MKLRKVLDIMEKKKLLNTKQHQTKCVYCEDTDHNSTYCKKIKSIAGRKNCTSKQHRSLDCQSKRACSTCNERDHSSICNKLYPSVPTIPSTDQEDVTHPVVVLLVDGVKCRGLLDTETGGSYVSAGLMSVLKKKTSRKETKQIEMMMNSTAKNIEVFKVQIENDHRDVSFETEFCKVELRELLKLLNPHYVDLIKRYHHLRGVSDY